MWIGQSKLDCLSMSQKMSNKREPHERAGTRQIMTVCVLSVVFLGVNFFQWDIIDVVTPFLWLPIFAMIILAMFGMTIWSVVYACRLYRERWRGFAPLIFCVLSIALSIGLHFTSTWVDVNFMLGKSAREKLVARIDSGELEPHSKFNHRLMSLPVSSSISKGGEVSVLESGADKHFVFFFTFRGILDNYSGFLWVPTGRRPEEYSDVGEPGTQIIPYGENWYFVGHR